MSIPAFGNSLVVEMFGLGAVGASGDTGWFRLEEEDTDFLIEVSSWSATGAQFFVETDLGVVGGTQRVYQAAASGNITGNGSYEPRIDLAAIPGGSRVRVRWTMTGTGFGLRIRAVETRNGQPAS